MSLIVTFLALDHFVFLRLALVVLVLECIVLSI